MSTLASALASRATRRWFFGFSALVFVAGVVAFLVIVVGNTGKSAETPFTSKPAEVYKEPRRVPLSREARLVAGRFIQTAVARKNLAASWDIVAPSLKRGFTKKRWIQGDIPVVPYLAEIGLARTKVDLSYPRYALIEVLLLPKSDKVKPQIFFLEMRKLGGRWLVTSWAPRGNFARPADLGD